MGVEAGLYLAGDALAADAAVAGGAELAGGALAADVAGGAIAADVAGGALAGDALGAGAEAVGGGFVTGAESAGAAAGTGAGLSGGEIAAGAAGGAAGAEATAGAAPGAVAAAALAGDAAGLSAGAESAGAGLSTGADFGADFGGSGAGVGGGSGFVPGTDYSAYTGETPTDVPNPLPDETIAPAASSAIPQGTFDKALGAATKYGPLALIGLGTLQGQSAAKSAGKQIASVGQPQRDAAAGLLNQYNSGTLNAGDAHAVSQFKADALAKSRQYFAQAGLSNSSQAAAAEAAIQAQGAAMESQMLQGYLTSAMNELNITDKNQIAGITAELQGDQQATASAASFLNAYGSWLRGSGTTTAKPAA